MVGNIGATVKKTQTYKLPNLQHEKILAIDIETHDPDLETLGPGSRRGDSYILGVAIATQDKSWYFSLAHPDSENIPDKPFIAWLNELNGKTFIGANLVYDLDHLQEYGFLPTGKLIDIQYAEPLLDENKKSFSLNALSYQYLGIGKNEGEIEEFCAARGLKGKPQKHLRMMPASLVGRYAVPDAELAFDIYKHQKVRLEEEGLINVFELECELMHLLLRMRRVGVRFDLDKLHSVVSRYAQRVDTQEALLNKLVGFDLNVNAPRSVEKAFIKFGYHYNRTEKGNPTFDEYFLDSHGSDLAKQILAQRKDKHTLSSFLSSLERHVTDGRIYSQFHPLRSDFYGTVSGRFSSSTPNLQQQPAQGQAKEDIRSLFIPEEEHDWLALDYSQIELRVLAHYARGDGADKIREMYINDPYTDFHQACADMIGIDRRPAKNINFGVVYGMGKAKMARELGMELDEAMQLISEYHRKMPFLRQTSREAMRLAERRGWVKTITGRKRRFPDPRFAYKALNSVIQGTAADIMKVAMVKAFRAGIFDVLPLHITVHDELDCSKPRTKVGDEAQAELQHICEHALEPEIELRVPLIADIKTGPNWACKK